MSTQQTNVFKWGGAIVSLIAGVYTLFHIFYVNAGHTADDYWGQTLLVLFIVGVVLAFGQFLQERQKLIATTSGDQFPEPAIARFFLGSSGAAGMWFVLRMSVGAQWFLAGWEKASSPLWGTSGVALQGFVHGALAKSAGANPAVQGWYANFLQTFVLPHAGLWSFAITWGELAVGLGVLVGALTGIAAGCGVLMNLNYLLAGTVSINPVLGMFGLFLVFAWRVAGYYGLDNYLLPALGLPWKPGTLFPATSNRAAPVHAS